MRIFGASWGSKWENLGLQRIERVVAIQVRGAPDEGYETESDKAGPVVDHPGDRKNNGYPPKKIVGDKYEPAGVVFKGGLL
ncbi:MAG: hypothetical protein R3335_14395 [Anaerolineales bacterium]|nr:hypothetical protein [Anaerolineales bacterium]